jgi:hypothetical protein
MDDNTMNPVPGTDDQEAGAEPTTGGDEQTTEEPAAPAADEASA